MSVNFDGNDNQLFYAFVTIKTFVKKDTKLKLRNEKIT